MIGASMWRTARQGGVVVGGDQQHEARAIPSLPPLPCLPLPCPPHSPHLCSPHSLVPTRRLDQTAGTHAKPVTSRVHDLQESPWATRRATEAGSGTPVTAAPHHAPLSPRRARAHSRAHCPFPHARTMQHSPMVEARRALQSIRPEAAKMIPQSPSIHPS